MWVLLCVSLLSRHWSHGVHILSTHYCRMNHTGHVHGRLFEIVLGAFFHHKVWLLFSLLGILPKPRRKTWLWQEPLITFIFWMLPGHEDGGEAIRGSGTPQCLQEPWQEFSFEWMSASVINPIFGRLNPSQWPVTGKETDSPQGWWSQQCLGRNSHPQRQKTDSSSLNPESGQTYPTINSLQNKWSPPKGLFPLERSSTSDIEAGDVKILYGRVSSAFGVKLKQIITIVSIEMPLTLSLSTAISTSPTHQFIYLTACWHWLYGWLDVCSKPWFLRSLFMIQSDADIADGQPSSDGDLGTQACWYHVFTISSMWLVRLSTGASPSQTTRGGRTI